MATLEVGSAVGPEASNTRKRRKKGRIIQKGYHKSEREDARRVAAKAFLSGIILDSNFLPRVQLRDSDELNTLAGQEINSGSFSRPISSASRHSNTIGFGDEALPSHIDVSGEGRLYEIALDNLPQLQHSSPSKLVPSKSLDYSFGTPSPGNYKPVLFSHSVSVIESQSDKRQNSVFIASAHKRWQAVDNSSAVYHLTSLSSANADLLVDSRSVQILSNLIIKSRLIFTHFKSIIQDIFFSGLCYQRPMCRM